MNEQMKERKEKKSRKRLYFSFILITTTKLSYRRNIYCIRSPRYYQIVCWNRPGTDERFVQGEGKANSNANEEQGYLVRHPIIFTFSILSFFLI